MKRIITLLVAMAIIGAVAQASDPVRGTKARVEPQSMNFTCMVGETVTDTIYVYNLSSSNIDPVCGFTSSPGYIWTNGVNGPIPPGGVGKGVVTYTPEQAGTHTASLSMNIGGEYYSVRMTGVATAGSVQQTDMPTLEYTYDDFYYTVTAHGNGVVKLYCEGQLVENPCVLPRESESYTMTFSATAQESGKLISETAYIEVMVMAKVPYILPTPVLNIQEVENSNGYYSINVYGDGELHLLINGVAVEIPYIIQQTYEEQVLEIEAYATPLDNPYATESEHLHEVYVIPAIVMPILPDPVITTTMDEDYVYVVADGGEGWITLYIDNEQVDNPCQLYRTNEDYTVMAAATSVMEGYQQSWAYEEIFVPAKQQYAPAATIVVDVEDDYVLVNAYNEGEGTMVMYADGEPVEMPYALPRLDEDYSVSIEVSNSIEGYLTEWVQEVVLVPAKMVEPLEMTFSPIINGTTTAQGYMIEIINTDLPEAEIHYLVCVDNGDGWIPSDWALYDGVPLMFSDPGHYRVEAYAIIEGKLESYHTVCEFVVTEVVQLYDFEENGIYYKITGDGQVSVTSETSNYGSYSGSVTIPATVTHDGTTYMVTAIGDKAFSYCEDLTAVTIGDYVTAIGNEAFENCYRLTSIELGDYVISIGNSAFRYCSNLVSVVMGKGLNSIGQWAFGSCGSITDVTCKAATPPAMFDDKTFDNTVMGTATLHVYPPVLAAYQNANYWNLFNSIVGENNVNTKPNDVNGDGNVTISDVTALIDILLNSN